MSEAAVFVLGAGSLGLLYASKLAKAGRPVTLLVKPNQAQALSLGVSLKASDASLPKRVFVRLISQPYADLSIERLIIATKAGQVLSALEPWKPHLSADAQILMLQNGLGSQAQVADQLLPTQTLLAASVTEGAYKETSTCVVHAARGETLLGRWSGPDQQAEKTWESRLTIAGLQARVVDAIRPVLWHKLAVNAVINPLTGLHRVANGALASREFQPQVQALCGELQQVFKRLGIPEPEGGLLGRVEQVIYATAQNFSSMYQDLQAGRQTEIDFITGSLLKAAKPLKLELAHHQQLYEQVKQAERHSPSV
ncbi:2-dehydropantoate 2-reductase [Marinospirillum sp. MEB164]|uniref:2-dehydropantoate 2-reductase n=1 Tax=Marinospirillum alkalitolerans TaxID=3123374 RepID=A0ABW8PYP2_9GAMM